MKILVIYGHHIEEHDFGKLVFEEYNRLYSPIKDLMDTIILENPAHQDNPKENLVTNAEILELAKKHRPSVLINIHHSDERSPRLEKLLRHQRRNLKELWHDLIYGKPTEIEINKPVWSLYSNPQVNPALKNRLPRNKYIGRQIIEEDWQGVDHVHPYTAINTACIDIEEMLYAKKGTNDEFYLPAVNRTIKIMRSIEEYVSSTIVKTDKQ